MPDDANSTIVRPGPEPMPDRIGPFRILGVLGEGGFGVVYEAEQTEPVIRRVALKLIKPGMDSKAVVARFEAERQALAVMNHPGVARVHDGGVTGPEHGLRPYFAMELVRGEPITDFCDKNRLTIEQRVRLFKQVCAAVQHAHSKGVIHRDLKPSNILVTHADDGPAPKVIDFGVAKALSNRLTESTVYTAMGQMIGTPAYMSPEQAEMTGVDIDTRADIYSLGVILYELLTGMRPFDFDGLSAQHSIQQIIRESEPKRPSLLVSTLVSSDADLASRIAAARDADIRQLEKRLRGELDWVVMKCISKERDRRYESANGLAMELQRFLDGEVVLARPPSTTYRAGKFVRRNRPAVIAAGVIVMALLGATGVSIGFALRAGAAERAANEAAANAERELDRATEIKKLITEMLSSIDPSQTSIADLTVMKQLLGSAGERLAAGEITDEIVAAEMHHIIGDVYVTLELLPPAERHLTQAVELRERRLGEDHVDTLESVGRLGRLYELQGRRARSEAAYAAMLERARRALGDAHPLTLKAMSGHAWSIWALERFEECLPLMVESYRTHERVLGPDDPGTLRALGQLSVVYSHLGRMDEALQARLREVEGRRLQSDPRATLVAMTNLSIVYRKAERYSESEQVLLESLQGFRELFGSDHNSTLWAMHCLGELYVSSGRYAEAEPVLRDALAGRRSVIGDAHWRTRGTISLLASCLARLDQRAEAVSLYRELVAIECADAAQPDATAVQLNRAAELLLMDDFGELQDPPRALRFAESACEIAEDAQSPLLPNYLDTLALARHRTGATAAAIEALRRAISLAPEDKDRGDRAARLAGYEAALAGH